MVCGGSMAPSIYRLTSTNKIASLSVPPNVVTQTAIFTKDRVGFVYYIVCGICLTLEKAVSI